MIRDFYGWTDMGVNNQLMLLIWVTVTLMYLLPGLAFYAAFLIRDHRAARNQGKSVTATDLSEAEVHRSEDAPDRRAA